MKRRNAILAIVIIAVLVSSIFVTNQLFLKPQGENNPDGQPEFYVGIQCGYDNVTLCKELIDRTKNYTNLFIIGATPITSNETLLNEVCDYAYAAGMHFSMYFSKLYNYPASMGENYTSVDWEGKNYTTSTAQPVGWIKNAMAKYGDKFIGPYFFDEPGGNQMDNTGQKTVGLTEVNSYQSAGERYTQRLHDESLDVYLNRSISTLTSDYSLYWFDYKAGYQTVLAEFGGNVNKQLQVALCRGAATVQGKDWGVMVTHQSSKEHVLESGDDLYSDLVLSYESGAKYAVVFDFAQTETYPRMPVYLYELGIVNDAHLEALQNFWDYMQQNPTKHGSIKADVALILPENFGFGFRDQNDKVWGIYEGDRWSRALWQDAINQLSQYGSRLDIVYEDLDFDAVVQSKYETRIEWSPGTITDSLPVKNLDSTFGYDTIQDAINSGATIDGDRLTVKAGTYRENVVVNKTLTITGEDKATTIIDGGSVGSAVNITASNVTLSGFTVKNSAADCGGIWLQATGNCTIVNNLVKNNHYGIYLNYSAGNVLKHNEMTDNTFNFGVAGTEPPDYDNDVDNTNTADGKPVVYLLNQNGVDINQAYPQAGYLVLVNCTGITAQNLAISNNANGIILVNTQNSNLQGNTISNCREGIRLINSESNLLKNNILEGNKFGFSVEGGFVNNIDASNTLNGKPIIYWLNQHGQTVPADAGYIALVNCSGITVQNQVLKDAWQGIVLQSTTNSTLTHNQIVSCNLGISLLSSHQIVITENNLTGNIKALTIFDSDGNTFTGNQLANNSLGGYLVNSSGNNFTDNTISKSLTIGLWLINGSDNNVIKNNQFDHNLVAAISCNRTSYNSITKNTVTGNTFGIQVLGVSDHTTITDNSLIDNAYGIQVTFSFDPFQLSMVDPGSDLSFFVNVLTYLTEADSAGSSSGHEISRNMLLNNRVLGIMVYEVNEATIADNHVKGGKFGISLGYPYEYVTPGGGMEYTGYHPASDVTLTGNTVEDGTTLGIGVTSFRNSTITNNTVQNFTIAMSVSGGSQNSFTDNTLSGVNGLQIATEGSLFRRNVITAQICGFKDVGLENGYTYRTTMDPLTMRYTNSLLLCINDIDVSNTINSKPIIYWVGQNEKTVPSDASCVTLVNCTNITVQNLNLANNYEGILLAFSNNCTVTGNNLQNNDQGIRLVCSSYNAIQHNTITNNGQTSMLWQANGGIVLYQQTIVLENETTGENEFKTNTSKENMIVENNISNNSIGIVITNDGGYSDIYVAGNTVVRNNFVNNTLQVQVPSPTSEIIVPDQNIWDNGSEGNYWSDYQGTGEAPYQIKAPTNIPEQPYAVMAEDRHPLTHPVS